MNNFIGEFLTIRGAFEAKVMWGALAATGIILGAAYMLWLYQRVFFGQASKTNETLKDLDGREFVAIRASDYSDFLDRCLSEAAAGHTSNRDKRGCRAGAARLFQGRASSLLKSRNRTTGDAARRYEPPK